MEPVNFQCGHCGNLMGVERAFLGQQVRCPHCQQIVVAPIPPLDPLTSPEVAPLEVTTETVSPPHLSESIAAFEVFGATEEDSIFDAKDQTDDGLFDEPVPQIEMPADVGWPSSAMDEGKEDSPAIAESPPQLEETYSPVPQTSMPLGASLLHPVENTPLIFIPPVDSPTDQSTLLEQAVPLSSSGPGPLETVVSTPAVRMPKSRPWLVPILVIPLISYSILATIAAALLYMEKQRQVHPLEAIPDQGENKGASRTKSTSFKWPDPSQALPDKLKVQLGQAIRVGDLEVIPEKVERRQIQYASTVKNAPQDPTRYDVLALVLRMKNISKDVVFKPMDPFFTRQWKPKNGGLMPYTYLSLGDQKEFGGPLSLRDMQDHHLKVVDQELNQELRPGEEMTTFVCTDPEDPVMKVLNQRKDDGPITWRVQVRRGLVQVRDRDISATAVIGVQFSPKTIE